MRKCILLGGAAVLACCVPSWAGVTLVNQGTGAPALAAWESVNGNAPIYTSVPTPATATVSQNNNGVTSAGASAYALIETFTPSQSYTLGAIGVSGSGAAQATNITMHLYDVTDRITSNNGSVQTGSGANYSRNNPAPAVDLLGGGAGLSFASPAQVQGELTFVLDNVGTSDQVTLQAGRLYALEFWNPYATPGGFNWWRAPAAASTDGQMMFSPDAASNGTGPISQNPGNYPFLDSRITITSAGFAGGTPRTASLALYPVPEPGSLAMFALAGAGLVARRRR